MIKTARSFNKSFSIGLLSSAILLATTATPALAENWTLNGSNIYNNNTGNVGIGTSVPTATFHISGAATSMSQTFSGTVENTANTGFAEFRAKNDLGNGLVLQVAGSVRGGTFWGQSDSGTARVLFNGAGNVLFGNNGTGSLILGSNNAERMRIDPSGNVGIGTTTPRHKLDVAGSVNYPGFGLMVSTTANATATNQGLITSGINPIFNVGSYATSDVEGLYIWPPTKVGTGTINTAYGILVNGPTVGATNWAIFATGDTYTSGRIRMGNWAADGVVAAYASANGQLALQSSDLRLKTNITPISDSLTKIDGITGVLFNWKTDPKDAKKTVGVIAQDVLKVLPEATFTFKDEKGQELYGVHYEKLTALLIQGVKDQQQTIENQGKIIENQGKEITDLKQKIEAIEKKLSN